jgi:membrane-bound lytic murein transglycosylase B
MRKLATVVATVLITSAAYAQSPGNSAPGQASPAAPPAAQGQTQSPAQIAQQIRQNLSQAGFTNIQLMPSSFLVRAQDNNGNPVMMVINPDSITAVTEFEQGKGATTGQGSTAPQGSKPNGATPNAK